MQTPECFQLRGKTQGHPSYLLYLACLGIFIPYTDAKGKGRRAEVITEAADVFVRILLLHELQKGFDGITDSAANKGLKGWRHAEVKRFGAVIDSQRLQAAQAAETLRQAAEVAACAQMKMLQIAQSSEIGGQARELLTVMEFEALQPVETAEAVRQRYQTSSAAKVQVL